MPRGSEDARGSCTMRELPMSWAAVVLAVLSGLAAPAGAAEPPGLDTVVAWMTGSFSSAAQAAADPEFLDIRLEMAPIWPGAGTVRWLYVEQAAGDRLETPYRQRVYRLREIEKGLVESEIYTIADSERLVGAGHDVAVRGRLTPGDITLREGCTVYLKWTGDSYAGGTLGTLCASDLRGAAYATTLVTLGDGRLESWDRGFDAGGHQVWGSEKGAYVFVRDQAGR